MSADTAKLITTRRSNKMVNDKEATKAVALAFVIAVTVFFTLITLIGIGMQAETAELPNNYCGINVDICD